MKSFTAILRASTCIPFGNAAAPQLDITDPFAYDFFLAYPPTFYEDIFDDEIDMELIRARFNGDIKQEKRLLAYKI